VEGRGKVEAGFPQARSLLLLPLCVFWLPQLLGCLVSLARLPLALALSPTLSHSLVCVIGV